MQWQSWADFWQMGGNGAFVWGSYGAWIALMAWELWQLRQGRRSTLQHLLRWRKATRRQAAQKGANPGPRSPSAANTAKVVPACSPGDLS